MSKLFYKQNLLTGKADYLCQFPFHLSVSLKDHMKSVFLQQLKAAILFYCKGLLVVRLGEGEVSSWVAVKRFCDWLKTGVCQLERVHRFTGAGGTDFLFDLTRRKRDLPQLDLHSSPHEKHITLSSIEYRSAAPPLKKGFNILNKKCKKKRWNKIR